VNSRSKGVSRIVIVVVILLAAVGLLPGLFVVRTGMVEHRSARQRLVRLLSETDYQTVLEACRELSMRVARGHLKPGGYGVRLNVAPEAPDFPQVILALEPACVLIENDGRVFVEMLGYPSYGVVAYPEGYRVGPYGLGDVELIPGLWYYHEDYDKYVDYRKDVNSLVERGRAYQWRTLVDCSPFTLKCLQALGCGLRFGRLICGLSTREVHG